MSQIALAWVIYKGVSSIVGFNEESRVGDAGDAVDSLLKLPDPDEEAKYLKEPYVSLPLKGLV